MIGSRIYQNLFTQVVIPQTPALRLSNVTAVPLSWSLRYGCRHNLNRMFSKKKKTGTKVRGPYVRGDPRMNTVHRSVLYIDRGVRTLSDCWRGKLSENLSFKVDEAPVLPQE
ncbi:hypothetical protein TNCV_1206211 [Trichonephila clavipes]|nr:hypothetical protein TNCV_1206211 [Trichonephila clavipes]